MKKIGKGFAALLLGAALLTACNEDDGVAVEQLPAIDVSTRTLQPDATGSSGESGSVRAFVGTVVTAQGFNLDRIARVTFTATAEGSEEVEAEIVEQSIKELKFKVPALGLAQRDGSYAADLRVYGENDAVVFRYVYYVTVPVTDALVSGYSPASGTVGTVVKIEGRNLEQIAEVRFGDRTILSDAFVETVSGSETSSVSFAVPAGAYAAGESEVAISAVWGGDKVIDVTGEAPFLMHTPNVTPVVQPEGENAAIGSELTITGEYLDLVSGIKWGDCELIVLEQTAESVTVKFPSSIEPADPVVVAADITAVYGKPAQTVVLAAAYRVDTTPQGPAKPVYQSFTAEDGGDANKLYLGKTVTVTGENMASIEGFLVDGVAAELVGTPNDVQAAFMVPDGVDFTEAKEVAVKAVYGGGSEAELFVATVYPFYYWKNVIIGAQDASNAETAFFVPNEGKVIPTSEWRDLDKYAAADAMTGALTLNKSAITESQYYEVLPYFFSTFSGGFLTLQSPANSNGQIRHFKADGTSITNGLPPDGKVYGVPIICFKVLKTSSSSENPIIEAVKAGSIGTMITTLKAGSGAPKYSTDFNVGDVILVQYVTYAFGKKSPEPENVCRGGFVHVKEVSEAAATGKIIFDMYWSKQLNR